MMALKIIKIESCSALPDGRRIEEEKIL